MNSAIKLNCINPFNSYNHSAAKDLYNFPKYLRSAYPSIPANAKVCSSCQRKLYKHYKQDLPPSDDAKKAKLECDDEYHKAGVAVLEQIKKKFSESTSKQDRMQLLTLAPEFWSRNDLIREFGCSEWEARQANELVAKNGIFSIPDKKKGKTLPVETVNLVKLFYESDDISRVMPGSKDYLSVKQENGKREHVQKRLLLGNINDIYHLFREEHEHVKIGLTKFTQLRPLHCVLSGSSGTHNVCVCVHHENVKLMLEAIGLDSLTKDTEISLKNYHDCIQAITCSNASDKCYLGDCLECPNMSILRKHLLECFAKNDIFQVEYDSWFQTDRCTIASKTVSVDEFMDILGEKLMKLKTHDFFAKSQSVFVKDLKGNLQEGEFLVSCDFAENYGFVVQNSAQSFHWNNNQATVFTVVVYYKDNNELKHLSIAIISDNLNHDTVSVYEYQKIIISHLKTLFTVKKIYYLTDGAGQHFKNKSNFQNLLYHEKDFGIPAEWIFHATAHGKNACDGIGANLKRGAKRASLQLSSNQRILTPQDLYNWAKSYCKETTVFYSSKESYDKTTLELKPRLDAAKSIPGTLQLHAIIPIGESKLMLKKTSLSSEYEIFPKKTKVVQKKQQIPALKLPTTTKKKSNAKPKKTNSVSTSRGN